MHLLQAGVDITVIALWLGHESPVTTHGYVEADLAMKEHALATIASPEAAAIQTLLGTAHPNGLDPAAWLRDCDTLEKLPTDELLPLRDPVKT
jgi:hypothetical protein